MKNTNQGTKIPKANELANNEAFKAAADYLAKHPEKVAKKDPDEKPDVEVNDDEFEFLMGIENARNLLTETIVTPPELIEGVLYKGGKMSINAPSKMGKTWTLLHLALSLANGSDWLGMKCKQSKVLFINPEIQDFSFKKRIQLIARTMSGVVSLENLDTKTTRGKKIDINIFVSALEKKLKETPYDVIIIDSIYKLFPASLDENSNSNVGLFLTLLERLTKAGCSLIYSHHYSKGNQAGKSAIDRSSGAGSFSRDPDVIVGFTEHERKNSYTVEFQLRDFKPIEPYVVQVVWPNITKDTTSNPKQLKTTKFEAVYMEADILKLLEGKPRMKTSDIQKLIKTETGMSNGKFFDLWRVIKPRLSESAEGWQYTPANN